MKAYKDIVWQVAKGEWKIKSHDSEKLAREIFGYTHPMINHLSTKILIASHTGGILMLLQTLDYQNSKLLINWLKTL